MPYTTSMFIIIILFMLAVRLLKNVLYCMDFVISFPVKLIFTQLISNYLRINLPTRSLEEMMSDVMEINGCASSRKKFC